jgi:hypothetical protein
MLFICFPSALAFIIENIYLIFFVFFFFFFTQSQEVANRNRGGFVGMSGMNKKPVNNPNEDEVVSSATAATLGEDHPSNRFLSKDKDKGGSFESDKSDEKVRSLGPTASSNGSFSGNPSSYSLSEEAEDGVGDDEEGPDRVVTVSLLLCY